jgi:hypothetical protein
MRDSIYLDVVPELPVADLVVTQRWFRDVLGFQVLGPGRIVSRPSAMARCNSICARPIAQMLSCVATCTSRTPILYTPVAKIKTLGL